jgi:hypothetical protein
MAAADWFDEQGPPNVGPMAPGASGGTTAWGTSMGTPPAAPAPGAPPQQQQAGGRQQVSDRAVQDILEKYPATNDGMRAAMVEIDRTFGAGVIKLLEHPTRLDKLVMPDGRTIDAMVGAGAPGASWGWMVEGGGHGGAGGTLGGLSGVGVTPQGQAFANWASGQGITPEGRAFADMVMRDRGAVGPLLGDPMAGKPITDDPSFGFRMDEGAKALARSAAARGTLLTGGAAKAMQRYAQDLASTEYQNSYNRRAGEQSNNYNRLAGVANFMSGEQMNEYARKLGAANFMSGEQMNQYNRYLGTANLGLNATNASQNLASGYADNVGNAQIGIGNSQGVATQYGAQANANTITNLGDIAGQFANNWYNRRSTPPVDPGAWTRGGL